MSDDPIDRILDGEEEILPSSGFGASVMEAVRREAYAPPPIPFPWKRAWPWLAAIAPTFAAASFLVVRQAGFGSGLEPQAPVVTAALESVHRTIVATYADWVALALLITLASIALSRRLARA